MKASGKSKSAIDPKLKQEDTDISASREALLKMSDEILLYLIERNKKDSSLRFWLRQKDSTHSDEERLSVGQWFQGSHYIFVGFSGVTDSNNRTQSIGFVANFENGSTSPSFALDLSYPAEHRKQFIECYTAMSAELSKYFNQKHDPNSKKHYFIYPEKRWWDALNRFLTEHRPIIEQTINQFKLKTEFEITERKFQSMLSRTLRRREELYGPLTLDERYNEQVNLQTESLAVEDRLERQPFVDSLKMYVEKLWKNRENTAYTIHLGGEWGSGKSKVLQMLKADMEKNGWVVVEFNAWQNQHIDPPWWVFMDSVYKGIQDSAGHKRGIWWKEQWWRLVELNQLYWWTFIGLVLLFLLINILSDFAFFKQGSDEDPESGDILATVTSYITMAGAVWASIKAATTSLVPASSSAAVEFQKNVRDPMQELKSHYSKIVGYTSKNVAVFIDDIDRCNPQFVVNLLEGIQTLFKSTKVLYLVAGDAKWIKKSFEIYYEKLEDIVNAQHNTVGNFFLEKTFQMSVSVPPISEETKKMFWRHLLNGTKVKQNTSDLDTAISLAQNEKDIDAALQKAKTPEDKVRLRGLAVRKMSESEVILENVEHKLEGFHDLLIPNPRSMKRLINNYALERKSLILSGVTLTEVSDDSLIKWIILKSRFPLIAENIMQNPNYLQESEVTQIKELESIVKGLTPEVLSLCMGR